MSTLLLIKLKLFPFLFEGCGIRQEISLGFVQFHPASFYLFFFGLYLVSSKTAHRVVGYFEEEAVISYSHYLAEIDEGRSPNVPAPQIAKTYWGLDDDATLRDVVLVVRADEAHHRDVNHSYANELAGLPTGAVAPCPPHTTLEPAWKTAA